MQQQDTHDRYDLILPSGRRGKGRRRFDDDVPAPRGRRPALGALELEGDDPAGPAERAEDPPNGGTYSTWLQAEHGPTPRPDWVVTELGAVDTELGVLKTGKEADVLLVERGLPGRRRGVLLAAKRYRVQRAPDVPPRRAATSRAAGCGARARTGRWRTARRSAAT